MTEGAQILVVDDELDVRSSVAEILRTAGYEVVEAKDGFEALELLSSASVGAILLDVSMPRCDGISMLTALDSPPPIVVISARNLDSDTQERLGDKITAFLKKPVPPIRLLEQLKAVLQREDEP